MSSLDIFSLRSLPSSGCVLLLFLFSYDTSQMGKEKMSEKERKRLKLTSACVICKCVCVCVYCVNLPQLSFFCASEEETSADFTLSLSFLCFKRLHRGHFLHFLNFAAGREESCLIPLHPNQRESPDEKCV